MANSGLRRDPLIAARVVAWLEDRYARRRAGDADAQRPFLLVASFVNPHDIVLFPVWQRTKPLGDEPSPLDPPPVPEAPTEHEDLATKPAAQIAYRAAYPSGYGPPAAVARIYERNAQAYRDLYHRLHAEVDGPVDRVRRAVDRRRADDAVLVRTADHGELLGAHGGLHQKWFNLYDEATRVPFTIARVGQPADGRPRVDEPRPRTWTSSPPCSPPPAWTPTPLADELGRTFSEVHALPGADLMPVVDGDAEPDPDRAVYLMTRDNMLEGDSGASGLARRLGRTARPPAPLRIQVPAHVAANFEGLVVRVAEAEARRGPPLEAGAHLRRPGHLDRARRPPPGRRRASAGPPTGPSPLPGPVGALRPRRRPDRGRQPGRRTRRPPRSSPTSAGA